jgi:branched-chain amino acid transport system permease protein
LSGKLWQGLKKSALPLALLALACVLPFTGINEFMLSLVIYAGIFTIGTMSLNIILGYAGQASLAQGAFFGIGAYSLALLVNKAHLNFWLAVPAACLITALFGLLIGIPAFRTSGPYFVIVTLCFNFIVFVVVKNWDWLSGGVKGQKIPTPEILAGREARYFLVLVCLVVCMLAMWRLSRSLEGLGMFGIRSNEALAEAVGINTAYVKIVVFMVSCFIAGLAGCLNAIHTGYLSPSSVHYVLSFNFIVYLVVGGAGSLYGPLVGTFSIYMALELLKDLGEYRLVIFGILLIFVVIYFPRGVVGGLDYARSSLTRLFARPRREGA